MIPARPDRKDLRAPPAPRDRKGLLGRRATRALPGRKVSPDRRDPKVSLDQLGRRDLKVWLDQLDRRDLKVSLGQLDHRDLRVSKGYRVFPDGNKWKQSPRGIFRSMVHIHSLQAAPPAKRCWVVVSR